MSTDITHVRSAGIDPRALGSLEPKLQTREDHGPYYLITVGEPIHRVDKRDGVPHLYPMRVIPVKTWVNWSLTKLYPSANAIMTAQNADREQVDATAIFAGSIVDDVLIMNPQYATMGTISVQAFAKLHGEDLIDKETGLVTHRREFDLAEFNRLIMPEPIWYDTEEVPEDEKAIYRAQYPHLADDIRAEGALTRRERLLKEAIAQLTNQEPAPTQRLYLAACNEILRAFAAYKQFGLTELGNADRQIKDREKSGKSIYDRADTRRQWLFARKGIDAPLVEQQAPVFNVQMPATAADVERQECTDCGEMISVKAKVCRYCGARFDAVPATPDADEFDVVTGGETTLQRKQREARERRGR